MRVLLCVLLSLGFGLTVSAEEYQSEYKIAGQSKKQKKSRRAAKPSLHDQVSGQGYGVAGCGLGSVVFGPEPGMIQVIASTTNNLSGSQTFGITSGTSNCDVGEMGGAAARFIEVNREVVAKEASRGQGEAVDGLANIFRCSDFQSFGQKIKTNYQNVFAPKNDSFESSRQIIHMIKTDAQLSQQCATLS